MSGFVSIEVKGDCSKTKNFLNRIKSKQYLDVLNSLASQGVDALASNTPKDTGVTAGSWYYEIESGSGSTTIRWCNSSTTPNGAYNIVLLLQHGHGTGTGGYVQGRDFINPAIRPVFDNIAETAWRVITES